MGKNPAITVVAKAEFAQSYMAHPQIAFLSLFIAKFSPEYFLIVNYDE
jgi:hypothetical protein